MSLKQSSNLLCLRATLATRFMWEKILKSRLGSWSLYARYLIPLILTEKYSRYHNPSSLFPHNDNLSITGMTLSSWFGIMWINNKPGSRHWHCFPGENVWLGSCDIWITLLSIKGCHVCKYGLLYCLNVFSSFAILVFTPGTTPGSA